MRRNAWNTFTRHQLIIINLSSGLVCVMWNHSSGRAQFSREGFLTNRHSAFWQPTHHRACMQSGRGCDVGCREQVITINGGLTNLEHLARQEMMSVMPWGWSWTAWTQGQGSGPTVTVFMSAPASWKEESEQKKQFDVQQGRLVTIFRCRYCGKSKTENL